jgi:phosphoadenosine phosphosulfate reductase
MMAFDQLDRPDVITPAMPDLAARLRDAHPQEVIEAAYAMYGDKLALVSSFGAESAVMLFGQTLDYRRQLAERLGLTDVRDLRPAFTDLATVDPKSDLWRTDVDACCNIRKVLPLDRSLGDFDAWMTGRKRFHGGDRLRLSVVEYAEGKTKFNPLANWGRAELDAYAAAHDLPAHPLVAQGFPSIGCWPCTKPAEVGADPRAGRWAGQDKTECGIHVARAPGAPSNLGGDI